MNIALLGATGFVGAPIFNEALDRGISSPPSFASGDSGPARAARREGGRRLRSAGLVLMLAGQDAVISAFNPGWKNPNFYED